MTALEHGISRLQPAFHSGKSCGGASPCRNPESSARRDDDDGRQDDAGFASGGGGGGIVEGERKRLSTCSFGGLNYPDVAFDELPLLAFADHFFRRRQTGVDNDNGRGRHGFEASPSPWEKLAVNEEGAAGEGELVEEGGEASLFGPIGHLFWRLCPDLGEFVAPWLEAFAGPGGLAPRQDGGSRLGKVSDGRVKVAFVSSRFGDHGTTKALAGLMRLLPRDYFEVRYCCVLKRRCGRMNASKAVRDRGLGGEMLGFFLGFFFLRFGHTEMEPRGGGM